MYIYTFTCSPFRSRVPARAAGHAFPRMRALHCRALLRRRAATIAVAFAAGQAAHGAYCWPSAAIAIAPLIVARVEQGIFVANLQEILMHEGLTNSLEEAEVVEAMAVVSYLPLPEVLMDFVYLAVFAQCALEVSIPTRWLYIEEVTLYIFF